MVKVQENGHKVLIHVVETAEGGRDSFGRLSLLLRLAGLLLLLLLAGRSSEPAKDGALHVLHHLLLGLLLGLLLHLEPHLSVLLDLLLHGQVVAHATFTLNILDHLALGKSLGRVLLTLHGHGVQLAGLDTEAGTERAQASLLGLGGDELVVLGTGNGLSTSELGGDVLALEGLEDLANITVVHGVDELKEGDEGHKLIVLRVTLPLGQDDGVFGLGTHVLGVGINDDDFGQVSVQIRKVLYDNGWLATVTVQS